MGFFDDDSDEDFQAKQVPEHSDDFKDKHHCTDVFCCVIFVIFLIAWGALYIWVMINGDTGRLYHGIQMDGKICGVDEGVEDSPMLYWCPNTAVMTNINQLGIDGLDMANPVCVSSCPTLVDNSYVPLTVPECSALQHSDQPYQTDAVMGRYCFPDLGQDVSKNVAEQLADSPGIADMEWLESVAGIENGYPIYIGAFVLAVTLSYLYVGCLKACAKIMIWVALFIAIVGLACASGYLIFTAPGAGSHDTLSNLGDNAVWVTFVMGIVFGVMSLTLLFTACCCAGQVQLAIMAVEMTGDVIMEMPTMLLAPLVKALVKMGMIAVMLYGFVKLLATCEVTTDPESSSFTRHYSLTDWHYVAIIFYMLGSYWLLHFANALYQFSIAYATADFYFTHMDDFSDRDVHCCFVGEGTVVGLMYHSGSLAFGSFIVAVFEVLQRLVEFAEKQNDMGGNNPITCIIGCVICFTKCILACCQQCIEFINKNAYIDMAITSLPFCKAARNALQIIGKLAGAMYVLNGVTYIFQLAGIAMITAICGFLGYTISYNFFNDDASDWYIENHAFPTIVTCIIAAGVAYAFMAVFDMVSDTLLYCMGVDGGTHAPPQLQDFVADANQQAPSKQARDYSYD